jgi:DNA modification methylase
LAKKLKKPKKFQAGGRKKQSCESFVDRRDPNKIKNHNIAAQERDMAAPVGTAWPADRVERWPITQLKLFEQNARTHSDVQLDQLAASMRQWGWTMPVLCDETGIVIAGHGRILAAQRLGLLEVPVMVARGWTEAQTRAYRLADNQLALNAGWDFGFLSSELQTIKGWDFDLGLLGFADIEALLRGNGNWLTDPDSAPPAPQVPVCALGDVWLLGAHRLVCGDSTQKVTVSAALNGVTPHLMVTDPPYGVDYDPAWRAAAGVNRNRDKLGTVTNDDRADWREAWALFPGDVAYVWHASWFTSTTQQSLEDCGFKIRRQIIWAKDRFALSRHDYHWQHEPCWYAIREKKTGHWAGDRSQSTLWAIPSREDKGHGHGTQKPVECMRRPIENNSSPGQAIYDPFVGTGTTIIAAEMTGRVCHAIEINPAYCDVSIDRWQQFTGKIATNEKDGREFKRNDQTRQAISE